MFPQNSLSQGWQSGLPSLLALVVAIAGASDCASAQITPDNTLGSENSTVTSTGAVDRINGGATRGTNLFHSFQEFNVDSGRTAWFDNPAGIENILSRVTGESRSDILGTLRVLGTANLFLINPNGIAFGSNARLNIGGSFVATTADALQFGDQGFFSASAPDVPPVLTVNPSALLFNQIASQPITNQSVEGLQLTGDQSLLLVGGDVNLQGGQLHARSGRVELGGLAGAGTVGLNVDGNNLRLGYPSGVAQADVSLTNGAEVDVSYYGGGDIQVQGRRVTLTDGSKIVANTLGSEPGGTLTVTASESVQVIGGSRLLAQTQGAGAAGDLRIETGRLIVQDGAAQVSAGTSPGSSGPGGTLTVRTSDSVELSGTATLADGTQVSSGLFTQTEGAGAAGNLSIETGQLIVQGGAQVSTSSTRGEGQAGRLIVTASEAVELSGTSTSVDEPQPSGLFAVTQASSGRSGDLTIKTGQLIVRDGAQVSASTEGAGQGGGTLSVTAEESVQLIGTSANGQGRSGLFVGTRGIGDAGDLSIETGKLQVLDGALVSARTFQGSTGKGGSIIVNAGELNVLNGAEVTVSSLGSGDAGNLDVTARSISLDDQGKLIAETELGQGGNITLKDLDLLLLRDKSSISTTAGNAQAGGDGGNITISTDNLVALKNSDITANAFEGRGGNVQINTQGIFGTQFREQLTPESDITASSEFGLQGEVEINNPDVDQSLGLVELPAELVDSNQIATGCAAAGENEFIITGRGGLPPNPRQVLSSNAVQVDWVELSASQENRSSTKPATNSTIDSAFTTIVEANRWVTNNKGDVVLTATAPGATLDIPWVPDSDCNTPEQKS